MPRVILTNTFGSSATPTVNAPSQKVQTGGFGDPNGLPGESKEAPVDGRGRFKITIPKDQSKPFEMVAKLQ